MHMPVSSNSAPELDFFFVGYLDILGQEELLKRFPKKPPLVAHDIQTINELFPRTFGAVRALRQGFQTYFEGYDSPAPEDVLKRIDPTRRIEYLHLRKRRIELQTISDSLVVYVSLNHVRDIPVPLHGVWGVLVGCMGMFVQFLAKGLVFRSAFEVGLGEELWSRGLYGPVIQSVYELERMVAKHPRLLVGEVVIDYLKNMCHDTERGVASDLTRDAAERCKKFLVRDEDGQMMLDYLGVHFRESLPSHIILPVSEAYEFVKSQIVKFDAEGNPDWADRYRMVERYFAKNADRWK
jgi:hypothetical protein